MATVKRDQILQEAEKLVSRGKLDQAVRLYRTALEQNPNDPNTLNRLGDLLARANRIPEAIEAYERVADHFAQDGFFVKSIAIYKKINRLDPQRTDVYEKLADLYFKQGLAIEGRQQLLTLADWFLRSKQPDEAVRVYRRLGELEPANFQVRGKLIDLLTQLGATEEAMAEIDSLGKTLLMRGLLDEAVKLYHRALDLRPSSLGFLAPCLDALVSGGHAAEAAELGRRALAAGRPDVDLQRATARALAEVGDLKAARQMLEGLLSEVGSRTDVVQLYGDVMLRVGESEVAKEHLVPAIDRLVSGGDTARAAALVKRLLRSVPSDIDVLERALKVFDRRDDPDMVAGIEAALADAYFRAGRHDAARPLYRNLAAADPANRLFRDRLAQLGEPTEAQGAPPAEAKTGAVSDEFEVVELDLEQALVVPEQMAPIPPLAEAPPPEPVPPPREPEPVAAPPVPEEVVGGTSAEELFTEAVVFAKYGLTEKAVAHLHRLLSLDPTHEEGRKLLASLGAGEVVALEAEGEAARELLEELPEPEPLGAEVEIPPIELPPVESVLAAAEKDGGVSPPRPVAATPSRPVSVPVPELEAIDALLKSPPPPPAPAPRPPGKKPVPQAKLDDLEAIIGLRPAPAPATKGGGAAKPPARQQGEPAAVEFSFDSLLAGGAAVPPSPPVPPPAPAPEPVPAPVELVDIGEVLAGPDESQLREVDFFIQQGLLDEAARQLGRIEAEYPGHAEVASRRALLKARGWEEKPAPPKEGSAAELFSEEEQFFDLARELEQELADEELVAEARGKGSAVDVSIEELFREFQKGVAAQLSEEDFDTHFNLGIAYREMGLLDEAIGEFQLAVKSPEYAIEAGSLIAGCYAEKGLLDEAAAWYTKTLQDPAMTPEAELGIRYELGRIYEMAGNREQALAHYAEVLAVNPGFRDVVDRVSRMQQAN
ncbi:MAG: tetratricopeptide repeat protein [Thermoanaerobaculaceae bacterium]|nr:tetratricopeptide repeat protein [Thermoanaerobaculaceae bacterium]